LYRNYQLVFLSLFLAIVISFTSLADEPDFATSSNWSEDVPLPERLSISARSSLGTVSNTVDYKGLSLFLAYYDMNNVIKFRSYPVDSGRYARVVRPSDYAKMHYIAVRVGKSSLPPSGNYYTQVDFSSDTSVAYQDYAKFYSNKAYTNASIETSQVSDSKSLNFSQFSGDWQASAVVDIGNVSAVFFVVYPYTSDSNPRPENVFQFPYSGYINVRFSRTKDPANVTTVDGGSESVDSAQDTANNTAQIAENTTQIIYSANAINDTLKEIVQHISNQLAALWDQMYNYMHVPDLANRDMNTQRIIDAMQTEITLQIETDRKNFDRLMENDDKNTEKITTGYDKSGLESGNNTLSTSLNAYDSAEDAIVGSISGYLESFVMPAYSSTHPSVLSACLYFGGYLQKLYDGINFFNFPIVISLTLIFVSMIIGYHRFLSNL